VLKALGIGETDRASQVVRGLVAAANCNLRGRWPVVG